MRAVCFIKKGPIVLDLTRPPHYTKVETVTKIKHRARRKFFAF